MVQASQRHFTEKAKVKGKEQGKSEKSIGYAKDLQTSLP